MTEVLVFHHAQERTPGIDRLTGTLRAAGHAVHLKDLYDGNTFDTLAARVAYAQQVGFGTILARGQLPQRSWRRRSSRSASLSG